LWRTVALVALRFRVKVSGLGIKEGSQFKGKYKFIAFGFRVQGSGFRVQGSGFRVQGSGFCV
jgi:hypothetical protein